MIQFEAWLSLVERRVRDAEAASSNLVASMTEKLRNLLKISKFRSFRLCYAGSEKWSGRTCMNVLHLHEAPHLHEYPAPA